MCVNFILLAGGAPFNISANKGSEAQPPKLRSNELTCFQETGVAGGFVVMAACENGAAEGLVSGNVDTTFVGEDAGFHLPVGESGAEGERNVLMHGLEGLEDEGVTRGCGFNAMREGSVNQVDKKGRWEESDISVVEVIRGEEVGVAGKGIGAGEKLSGDMDHFEVKAGKVDKPTFLAAVQRLGLMEIGEVLMVGENLYREGGTMKIVAPGFEGTDDC